MYTTGTVAQRKTFVLHTVHCTLFTVYTMYHKSRKLYTQHTQKCTTFAHSTEEQAVVGTTQ